MTIEDIIAMVRAGKLRLAVRKIEEDEYNLESFCAPDQVTPEMLDALRQHMSHIFFMVKRSDIQICIAPDEHRASYLFKIDSHGKVRMCPLCEAIREEEVRNLPPPNHEIDKARTGQARKEQ